MNTTEKKYTQDEREDRAKNFIVWGLFGTQLGMWIMVTVVAVCLGVFFAIMDIITS